MWGQKREQARLPVRQGRWFCLGAGGAIPSEYGGRYPRMLRGLSRDTLDVSGKAAVALCLQKELEIEDLLWMIRFLDDTKHDAQ